MANETYEDEEIEERKKLERRMNTRGESIVEGVRFQSVQSTVKIIVGDK